MLMEALLGYPSFFLKDGRSVKTPTAVLIMSITLQELPNGSTLVKRLLAKSYNFSKPLKIVLKTIGLNLSDIRNEDQTDHNRRRVHIR